MSTPQDGRRRPAIFVPPAGRRRARLQAAGMARRDLEHSRANDLLHQLTHGVYCGTGLPNEPEADPVRALLQGLTESTSRVVSFETAARLWGLIPGELRAPLHISSPAGGARVQRPHLVVGHRITVPEQFVLDLGGIRVTSPAWTWLDLVLDGPPGPKGPRGGEVERAVILGDQVVRHPRGEYGETGRQLASIAELREAVRARGRTKGIRGVREALGLIREGVDSPQESRLRYFMHLAGLPEPLVNPVIRHPSGYPWFEPDLTITAFRVAIQYEGEEFHSTPHSVRKDVRRSEITEQLGWIEVRITADHMADQGRRAIQRIQRALLHHGWRPERPTTHS
ncbi:hypothetical protein ACHABQ_03695 [Nesterenkonia aurantiaca]|uniref:hypothetical protein n=1 Tax=Nesterenkonia aurantiaca TaxID=1436010 RepID=UPI003EE5CDC7